MTAKEKDIISKLHKCLFIKNVKNNCDIKAIVEHKRECEEKIKIVRLTLLSLYVGKHNGLYNIIHELKELDRITKKYDAD